MFQGFWENESYISSQGKLGEFYLEVENQGKLREYQMKLKKYIFLQKCYDAVIFCLHFMKTCVSKQYKFVMK